MINLGLHIHDKARSDWCDTTRVFEGETGDSAWRHWSAEMSDSRRSRDLAVCVGSVVGIHDYLLDWIVSQDGAIEMRVGTTGILEVMTVEAWEAMPTEPGADAYDRFVDRSIVAVNHDHYLSYRLDLDINGTDNRFVVDRLVTRRLPEGHPRRSFWVHEERGPETEHEARPEINLERPALWRFVSNGERNSSGDPTSFRKVPSRDANTLLPEDDYPRWRAGIIDHHLWATSQRD